MTGTGIAAVAALLGDASRAAMCEAMLDGRPWTVTELADTAGVGKACASEHVARLEEGGLVATEVQGRCRYVRLAGPEVGAALEGLGRLAAPPAAGSLDAVRRRDRLAAARTCYDHLAGRLGVAVFDGLLARRLLARRNGLVVTASGRERLADLGVDVGPLEAAPRPLIRECTDLTERRPHLAGGLGAALCDRFLAEEWVRRPDRSRALVLTPVGERTLESILGVTFVRPDVARPDGPSSTVRHRLR